MDNRFFPYVWRHSRADQLYILALTVATLPLTYVSLEIPKIIVNRAIQGGPGTRELFGFPLDQIPYLVALCFGFIAVVVLINVFKWVMNISVGMCGERMLRRLRQSLLETVMRYPQRRFAQTRPGEVVQAVMAEVEPLGGFIGEVVSTPAYQGGTLVVYVGFIFVQDFWLGLAALSLFPVQFYFIPLLQKKVILLNKERARNSRALADSVAETVTGVEDIHGNGVVRWRMALIAGRLYRNTELRLALYNRKFLIKFLNNFLNQLTPFMFFLIGGWLVIEGRLDLGALVAVLAAYKDISKPWRELLNFYQRWSDFNSRFTVVVESFMGGEIMPAERLDAGDAAPLRGALEMRDVETAPEDGALSVGRLEVAPGRSLAVTGGGQGARASLMRIAAGLQAPAAGQARLGGVDLAQATLPRLGAAIGYVAPDPTLFDASIRENLLIGLYRGAPDLSQRVGDDKAAAMLREALRTGSPTGDPEGDWVDYAAAGLDGPAALDARLTALVDAAGLGGDLVAAALRGRPEPDEIDRWSRAARDARAAVAATLEAEGLGDAVERWDRSVFIENATLLQNILFAAPQTTGDEAAKLADPAVAPIVDEIGAGPFLREVGAALAKEIAGVVATVGRDSAVLESLGGFSKNEALAAADLAEADPEDAPVARALAALGARFAPQRDRFDVLGPERRARAMALRAAAAPLVAAEPRLAPFDGDAVIPAFSIGDNLLGGLRRNDRRSAWKALDAALDAAVTAAGLREALTAVGLRGRAGPGGAMLTQGARRRVALVRALLKRPSLLVLAGPLEASLRAAARAEAPDAAILYAADDEAAAAEGDAHCHLADNGALSHARFDSGAEERA